MDKVIAALIIAIAIVAFGITNLHIMNTSPKISVCEYPTYHVQYKHSGLFTWYYNTVEVPKQVYDKINDGDTMLVFSTKGK